MDVVVFVSIRGNVHGYRLTDGQPLWTASTGRSITGAPCLLGDRVDVASLYLCESYGVTAIEHAGGTAP
jgi:hypothetical protein